jgi:hypothetical protein
MGRVSAGWITLNGLILELRCIQYRSSSDGRNEPSYLLTGELPNSAEQLCSQVRNWYDTLLNHLSIAPLPEKSICDLEFDERDYFSAYVTCLLFCKPDTESWWTCGLVLQSTGTDGEYQRVGFWSLEQSRADLAPLWTRFEQRTITLV